MVATFGSEPKDVGSTPTPGTNQGLVLAAARQDVALSGWVRVLHS